MLDDAKMRTRTQWFLKTIKVKEAPPRSEDSQSWEVASTYIMESDVASLRAVAGQASNFRLAAGTPNENFAAPHLPRECTLKAELAIFANFLRVACRGGGAIKKATMCGSFICRHPSRVSKARPDSIGLSVWQPYRWKRKKRKYCHRQRNWPTPSHLRSRLRSVVWKIPNKRDINIEPEVEQRPDSIRSWNGASANILAHYSWRLGVLLPTPSI